jgi:hypothetical protein
MCSFLPPATDFYVTSHSILSCSSSFGTSLPVGIIIIYDANGSVDMLKKFSQLVWWKVFNTLYIRRFVIFII